MDTRLAQALAQREADQRLLFPYFKDRYALLLLSRVIGNGISISALRQTRFARLLQKPLLRELLADAGTGRLEPELLQTWPAEFQQFVVTLGVWDEDYGWAQTSRPGANLVIQLNFSNAHTQAFRRVFRPDAIPLFESDSHPVHGGSRRTLGWVRVDVDPDTGEALIEEVQNDWLRRVRWVAYRCARLGAIPDCYREVFRGDPRAFDRYLRWLRAYEKIWDEAALAAAIGYLEASVGIQTFYYHRHESGCHLKGIEPDWAPPRSLYTDLPKRFCMEPFEELPPILRSSYRKIRKRLNRSGCSPSFYRLALEEGGHHAQRQSHRPQSPAAQGWRAPTQSVH